jgi:hypothetical protein
MVWHTIPFPCMVWYTIHVMHGMVCISLPLYGMVWYTLEMVSIGNFLHWKWYALEMVYIGMVWYGMLWHTIPFPCIVWYTIRVMHGMICIAFPFYGMH